MAIAYRERIDDDTEFALWRIEEEATDLYSQLQLDQQEKDFVESLQARVVNNSEEKVVFSILKRIKYEA